MCCWLSNLTMNINLLSAPLKSIKIFLHKDLSIFFHFNKVLRKFLTTEITYIIVQLHGISTDLFTFRIVCKNFAISTINLFKIID